MTIERLKEIAEEEYEYELPKVVREDGYLKRIDTKEIYNHYIKFVVRRKLAKELVKRYENIDSYYKNVYPNEYNDLMYKEMIENLTEPILTNYWTYLTVQEIDIYLLKDNIIHNTIQKMLQQYKDIKLERFLKEEFLKKRRKNKMEPDYIEEIINNEIPDYTIHDIDINPEEQLNIYKNFAFQTNMKYVCQEIKRILKAQKDEEFEKYKEKLIETLKTIPKQTFIDIVKDMSSGIELDFDKEIEVDEVISDIVEGYY